MFGIDPGPTLVIMLVALVRLSIWVLLADALCWLTLKVLL